MTTRVATKDLKPGYMIDLGSKQGWREVLSKSPEKHAMTPGYRLVMSDPQIVKFPVWAAADKKWETQMDTNETKAPAPQTETPEVDEDALDNETARKDWERSIYKQIDTEDAIELSAEPRTEAQPPADLAGDGKQMPERKRAKKDEPRTPGVIETLANLKVDALGPIEALTKLYELKRLATKEWTSEGVEFAGDDPLATADLVHQVEGLQTDLEAEKALRAGNLAQIRTLDETVVELTRRNAELEATNAELREFVERLEIRESKWIESARGDAQKINLLTAERDEARAAALKFTEFASHWRAIMALVAPEATAPANAEPYKVNGVKA